MKPESISLNPLNIIASWQTLLMVALIIALTGVFKLILNLILADSQHLLSRAAIRQGADTRKQHPVLSQVVLPMTPLWLGAGVAMALQIAPKALEIFITTYLDGYPFAAMAEYAAYGVVCGVLADYSFSRAHDTWRVVVKGSSRAG